MDPFGTGAGIVGVIGLTIQITQVVVQFGMDWKEAPENVKTFMAELGTLKTVLSETNTNILLNPDFTEAFQGQPSVLLSQLGSNAPPTTDTKQMLEICHQKLESLLIELKKRGQGHRLGWERFKGAFLAKDTQNSVQNLCRQCQTLNNMLSIDTVVLGAATYKEVKDARREQQEWHQAEAKTSMAIRSGVDESNRRQDNQERQAILDWITPFDYAAQQHDFIRRREEGTGQWLLDSKVFQTWLNTDKQTLFCPGIPGAGKTIITSIVVEELTTRFQDNKDIGIAYLYCNFRRKGEQKIDDLLMSLLKQLAESQLSLPETVKDLYERHNSKHTRPSLDDISMSLHAVTSLYSRVFILVDALDECQVSDSCRPRLLSSLFDIQANSGANILATSRFIPEITERFSNSLHLEILASEQDVGKFLDSHISQLPSCVLRSPKLQDEIKVEIINSVEGMYVYP